MKAVFLLSFFLASATYAANQENFLSRNGAIEVSFTDPAALSKAEQEILACVDTPVGVFKQDLNRDGQPDYVVSCVCGNKGCDYSIIDGESKKQVADFGGSRVLLLKNRINHWPVVTIIDTTEKNRLLLNTLVFNEEKYVEVSSVSQTGSNYSQTISEVLGLNQNKVGPNKLLKPTNPAHGDR